MKLAVISVVRENWSSVPAFLAELRSLLARSTDIDASLWLVDDVAADRPASWHSLDVGAGNVNVIELQGRQGRARSFVTAIGYLLFEREEDFDALLLLDVRDPTSLRKLEPLFETAQRHPGSAVIAPGGPARSGWLPGLTFHLSRWLFRALSGELPVQSPAILLPVRAAETLCHSCHSASHVEAALRRLRVATVPAKIPSAECGLELIAAASVFREQVFERSFRLAMWLFAATLLLAVGAGIELARGAAVPALTFAVLALGAAGFGGLSLLSLLLGIFSHSLNEARRWTPAVDSTLIIREVTRLKRQPYPVTGSG